MQDDLGFMYTSDPWGKPSQNSCFLLSLLKIRIGGRNCPSGLQHVFIVTFLLSREG
jgi:hypothetical protein